MNANEISDRLWILREWDIVWREYFKANAGTDIDYSMDGLWKWWGEQKDFAHDDTRLAALEIMLDAHEKRVR